ncbi:hypothetical protein DDE82_000584 [Stemphylium lycopersici]|nr:hypothetical protein DDE82_000584 [Stemphylium lycopersici]
MPHSSSISPISRPSSTEPSTIRDSYYGQDHQQQAHSNISQDPHVITFSTQSPTILPMTDYNNNHQSIEFRDLNSGLTFAENQSTTTTTNSSNNKNISTAATINNHGDTTTHAIHAERCARSPSIDSAIMPRFTKSSTISTTDTNDTSASSQASQYHPHYNSGLRIAHTEPSSKTHAESVGVAAGDFSKPRINKRSRRNTSSSSGSARSARSVDKQQEFKYYGRHGNQWLFNDFSVTEAVSKGFRRVFSGGKEGGPKDWYEDRDR